MRRERYGQVLRECDAMVVISGYASDLYDFELYPDWNRVERPALADGAVPRTEVLWLNPLCSNALSRERSQFDMFDEVMA
jgi:DNA adenine methylase